MTKIQEDLEKRQVFEIHPGDRVYLSYSYYDITLLKDRLKKKIKCTFKRKYTEADVIIIDEYAISYLISNKLMHDPYQLDFRDRALSDNSGFKTLKDVIAYMLNENEDVKYILMKDVYPLFLKTLDKKEAKSLQTLASQNIKLFALAVAGYDPYSFIGQKELVHFLGRGTETWRRSKGVAKSIFSSYFLIKHDWDSMSIESEAFESFLSSCYPAYDLLGETKRFMKIDKKALASDILESKYGYIDTFEKNLCYTYLEKIFA